MESGFYNKDCIEGMKEYPDKFFDLAIVDPVYGDVTNGGYMTNNKGQHIGTGSANSKGYHAGLWNQGKTGGDYFKELFRVSKNQVIWGGNYFTEFLPCSQCWIVWDKQHAVERSFADVELAWTSFDKASRIFRYMWDGFLQGNMNDREDRIHPTQKPIALYSWILNRFAKSGDKILDTHVGSASSLIACHRMKFDYIGFEIDKVYYRQAKERLDQETKQIDIFEFQEVQNE